MAESPQAVNPFEPPRASLEVKEAADAPPLWNPDAAGAWSLLFSPIFGSIIVRKNWKSLDQPSKARTGSYWIGFSVFMLVVSIVIGLLGFLYIIVWYFAWQKPQSTYIRERWGRAYPRKGWLLPLALGVVGWFGMVLLVYLVTFALASLAR